MPAELGDVRDYADRHPTGGRVVRHLGGLVEYPGLHEGSYHVLVRSAGYLDCVLENVPVPGEGEFTLAMSRGAHIVGRVLYPSGVPVPGLAVFLRERAGAKARAPSRGSVKPTDAQGTFTFSPLAEGTYTLAILGREDEPFLLEKDQRIEKTLYLPTQNRLRIRVGDEAGSPLANATVQLLSRGSSRGHSTDRSGQTEIAGVESGLYALSVTCDGFLPERRYVRVLDTGFQDIAIGLGRAQPGRSQP
ncbi:MAG: carboxypeptidase-like regulatory domain-containing protein [Planctomycetota bacterium]